MDSSHTNLDPCHSSEVSHQVDSMDRHAAHAARDDGKKVDSNNNAQKCLESTF
ncbi:hypothetical protein [Helicobacter zhangjianzhongii]|uniref:Uncharacterized protein n=1 Tax=Helicobacter zhangjianzhongii TaxID=2974574 RepID=A0ACC6FPL5_9HELI|nr:MULTISPECIES: hypothetical protein [unclassified Helicobacter]MDL0079118.1 hypothetical protein [Helicobacter sp. CPD2-1]MDL0081146.1 hypothetical protein [Helicobacter sp. XJK30-2]